jgi:DHA2 family multidrug resistance protein
MLSKGEEWDWLGDPFGRVQTLAMLFVVGLGGLIFWELRQRNPVVNFRPLRERNFSACCIIIFAAYAVLYGASTSLPGLLQSLFGYDALHAGIVMSPAGLFPVMVMPVVAILLRRQTDARWVIIAGLLVMAAGNYWMSLMNLDISPGQVVWPRVATVAGLAICFAPANVAAYLYTPKELRGAAVGLLNLLRNEGGSVGTSLSQALHEQREQFHSLRLGEYLDPFNPAVQSFTDQARAIFLEQSGDPVAAQQLALQALDNVREQQASALAYFDCFWVFAMITLALVPFVLLMMKRSVAEKGARVGGRRWRRNFKSAALAACRLRADCRPESCGQAHPSTAWATHPCPRSASEGSQSKTTISDRSRSDQARARALRRPAAHRSAAR